MSYFVRQLSKAKVLHLFIGCKQANVHVASCGMRHWKNGRDGVLWCHSYGILFGWF